MATVKTLMELKTAELERKRRAVAALKGELAAFATAHSGRCILYGSAARGTMRHDSDVDILTDFPADLTDDAWVFAEDACWRRRLTPDIRPRSWCSQRFLDHIAPDSLAIP